MCGSGLTGFGLGFCTWGTGSTGPATLLLGVGGTTVGVEDGDVGGSTDELGEGLGDVDGLGDGLEIGPHGPNDAVNPPRIGKASKLTPVPWVR